VRIPYPGGDVPPDTGVCTDEIIRSYRVLGIDLQKEVHEDMVQNHVGVSAEVERDSRTTGRQHRPPPRSESDGIFPAQG